MIYYSTNRRAPTVDLRTAVIQGLAADNGLYMPARIDPLPVEFFRGLASKSLRQIGFEVASHIFQGDLPPADLRALVDDALSFETPLVPIADGLYALELFHGPTLAFKDVGARFMARLLGYFTRGAGTTINVLVATSGDTGSAVAHGFYSVPGIRVFILYPKGLVSPIQERQFTTLGQNITALEIDGTFDECQRLVKEAFLDPQLSQALPLTSANSINLARLIPQSFYYYYGYAQLMGLGRKVVVSVPSGNFGNLCAGLIAKRTGLPVEHFLSATNANDIVPQYLASGRYEPRPSVATIANAMDVGSPSNFARILDLYGGGHQAIAADVKGYAYTDAQIRHTIRQVHGQYGYLCDPHGAIGFRALQEHLAGLPGHVGFFIATAHPAKFQETMEETIGQGVPIPDRLQRIIRGERQVVSLSSRFDELAQYLMAVAR